MCFSSNISFLSSAALTLIGIIGLIKAKNRSYLPFAFTPILFAMQQFSEGFVWLTQPGTFESNIAAYSFITFAMLIWPIWMPVSTLIAEPNHKKRKQITIFLLIGIAWVIYMFHYLLNYPLIVEHSGRHIKYILNFNDNTRELATMLYLIPTSGPFFISSIKNIWVFGILIIVSCFASYIIWANYFISLWCFFAACLSLFVLKVVLEK